MNDTPNKPASNYSNSFKMRQLPKAEYRLMQAMIAKYGLDDPCELFTCLLRLGYEIINSEHFGRTGGEKYWQQNIIATYRSNPVEQRDYTLPA